MNIIFIDFDGVLNNRLSMFVRNIDRSKGLFSRDCVDLFKILLDKTDSKFVVSSSWRARGVDLFDSRNAKIHRAFEENGFPEWQNYVFGSGVTKHLDTKLRGNDIQEFIDNDIDDPQLEYHNYVIIDDDSDMLPHQYKHFVQTNGIDGLTVHNIMHAARILEKKLHWNME